MKYKDMILIFTLFLSLCLVQNINAATIELWDIFPDNQGENNIFAYAYSSSGTYRQLADTGSYVFSTPGRPWNIPYIAKGNFPWIVTHPSGLEFGVWESTRLCWIVPSNISSVDRVTGLINPWDGGEILFRIWQNNALRYNAYVTSSQVSFDVPVSVQPGESMVFEVTPGPSSWSYNDTTFYRVTMDYTPVPEPATLLLVGSGLAGLIGLRRGFKS